LELTVRLVFAICATLLLPFSTLAQSESDASTEPPPFEEVLVTGEFPGPGMWKVTRADDPDQHVLWILGSPPPLPKKMRWKSADVENAVISSQEILLGASLNIEPDQKIGFFKGLTLLPAALGARKNPDGAKLKTLVPAETYERWLRLKKQFLGRNEAIESWRPIFAGFELREEAYDDLKLQEGNIVADAVTELAKKHKIKTTQPKLQFTIKSKEIRAKIKQFAKEPLADAECFDGTLRFVEALADRDTLHERATAWATGDLAALVAIEPLPNFVVPCQAAVMSSQIAREVVPGDIAEQLRHLWLAAAERGLAMNRSTFAYLSVSELTTPEGQLAALRAKGYLVEEPARD
jgi:hypothetical protein